MKESYKKDIASHLNPESCGGIREAAAEALTGADTGEVSSREIRQSELPTLLSEAEGHTESRVMASGKPSSRGRRPSACIETHRTGTGRSQSSTCCDGGGRRVEKTDGRKATMHDSGKSDGSIVSENLANDDLPLWQWAKEQGEKRGPTKRNPLQGGISRTQSRNHDMSSALERVRERAKTDKTAQFNNLFHLLTLERLERAYEGLKPKASAGVDGETWTAYKVKRDERLRNLLSRLHRGAYRAKPTRRVFIPKSDGRERPLGIAALEDKIVQSAVSEILNAIYEVDFRGFSCGFRPGRSPHQALDAWATVLKDQTVRWVLDLDIRSFFDELDHQWLLAFLQHRISDPRMLRLIGKWIKAGFVENGKWESTQKGSPQGAVISPLLANIYLHYVFDLWVDQWRKRQVEGKIWVVRYADDAVLAFEKQKDARRFLAQLKERMAKFNLQLHPDKTRSVRFGPFAEMDAKESGKKVETIDFLGFTHICGRSQSGKYLLMRHTIAKRQRAKLKEIRGELLARRHLPVPVQGAWLKQVVNGYFNYYAVPTNLRAIDGFRTEVIRAWRFALKRRSQRHRLPWTRMTVLSNRWIPRARIRHPWPWNRFHANTQGRSRVR